MAIFGLKRAGMLLTTTLGCQRRQKAAPKRLPEVGLSLVQMASLHKAVVAPVNSTFALAELLYHCWILDFAGRETKEVSYVASDHHDGWFQQCSSSWQGQRRAPVEQIHPKHEHRHRMPAYRLGFRV